MVRAFYRVDLSEMILTVVLRDPCLYEKIVSKNLVIGDALVLEEYDYAIALVAIESYPETDDPLIDTLIEDLGQRGAQYVLLRLEPEELNYPSSSDS